MAAQASSTPISPLILPPEAGDLIVFGGSFDPPTRAHIDMAQAARAASSPQAWLILVPAARSPHKPDAPAASDADRVAMLSLAVTGLDRRAIWTDELDRSAHHTKPSYMLETIERLVTILARQGHRDTTVRLLIGADQAIAFHRWRGFRQLASLAEPLVMLREPILTVDQLVDRLASTGAWDHSEIDRWARRVVPVEPIEASASAVRDLLGSASIERSGADSSADRAPGPTAALDRLLDPAVLDHIRAHGLYRTRGAESR